MRAFFLVLVLMLVACSSPGESTAVDQQEAGPGGGACVRSGEQYAPSSASCYRVTAVPGSVLANCFGEHSSPVTNEELTPSGPGYHVTAFDVPAGGCFYFYACDGGTFEQSAPSVEACR